MTNPVIAAILSYLKPILYMVPFILMVLLDASANLKRERRPRQFLMPVIALIFCIVLAIRLNSMSEWLQNLLQETLPASLNQLAESIPSIQSQAEQLSTLLTDFINSHDITLILFYLTNALLLLAYVIAKRIIISVLSSVFGGKEPKDFMSWALSPFYYYNEEDGAWYLHRSMVSARTYLKTFFVGGTVVSVLASAAAVLLYKQEMLAALYYPVFGVILLGELYFLMNGLTRNEAHGEMEGEKDLSERRVNYVQLREALRRLFGDKLSTDNTTVNNNILNARTNEEVLRSLKESGQPQLEAYGIFMEKKLKAGLKLDHNYVISGMRLLQGKSILFNNPFYYDFIPYIFYPMNHELLRHSRILIVLGRHGTEDDTEAWIREGMLQVTNVPTMWNIGVLTEEPQENLHIGIMTRSSVHDMALHEANREFLGQVSMVLLMEPSRLVSSAQVGLNSLVRCCRADGHEPVFCSCDKNCDGLLDALSHILMTSLEEVSATNRHTGVSSYMCWDADDEYLQHRMLPNLSRYLGLGTELSFAALKNQVDGTRWYGGDAFPVTDIHWIVRQYYYDLLNYAGLPTAQETLDDLFRVTPNLWDARVRKHQYMTVEDEAFNMFEIKRDFSTRATEQGFVNVISTDYLLKDYMAENDSIFNADPKAIPYIVADYAHTPRNVVLRLCLRLSVGMVSEAEIAHELMLIEADGGDVRTSLWHQLCSCYAPLGRTCRDRFGNEWLTFTIGGRKYEYSKEVILEKRRFSMDKGVMETMYFLKDHRFISAVLGEMQNAGYIAENENGENSYLGTELRGHVFQKYLPGQFFTFSGKYYEMLRVTPNGRVLVRRAADHIDGRPGYRQVRNYFISAAVDSALMGDKVEIGGMEVTVQYADIRVETPAYWKLPRYNDFARARLVRVNGIPERTYLNKQLLRLRLPEELGATPEIVHTVTVLFNEVFRTLFAENQAYIAAVEPCGAKLPATFSLSGENGFEPEQNCIYIIEDSQMDLGLLVAVRRNLDRIFSIICDYLTWHQEAADASRRKPPAPEKPDYTIPGGEEPPAAPEKKTLLGAILLFFRKLLHLDTPEREQKRAERKAEKEQRKREKAERKKGAKPEQPAAAEAEAPEAADAAGAADDTAETPEGNDEAAPVTEETVNGTEEAGKEDN